MNEIIINLNRNYKNKIKIKKILICDIIVIMKGCELLC